MSRPNKRKITTTEQLGVKAVEIAVLKMGWIPREQFIGDFGVDVQIETARPDGTASGRLLAIQVKAGLSYFERGNDTELHYYASQEHDDYWKGHSLPTLIAFYNPDTEQIIWQWTSESKKSRKQWKISVPRTQELNESVKDQLAKVANEGKPLDQTTATRLEAKVESAVEKGVKGRSAPTEVVAMASADSTIRPVLQTEVAGELSPAALAQLAQLLDDKLKPLKAHRVEASAGSTKDARRSTESDALHVQIDQLRDIKNDGHPTIAHKKLFELLPKIDRSEAPYAYFRAVTNLAACALDLGQTEEAKAGFEEAYHLEPSNALAVANLGLVKLLNREHQAAFDLATRAIEMGDYPSHALTILVGAAAKLNPDQDPNALIPEADRGKTDADFAVAEFMRVTSDPSWVDRVLSDFKKHPTDGQYRRLHAHAVLEAATTDQKFIQGGQSRVSVSDVAAAAEVLRADVETKLQAGFADKAELADEATNVAVAYRIIGEFGSAIDFLKRILVYTGHQPNAIRLLGLTQGLNDEEPAAIETLATIPDDGEAQLLRAEMLGRDDPKKALADVLALSDEIIPDHHKTTRWIVTANLALAAEDDAALDQALTRIRDDAPYAAYADILNARRRSKAGVAAEDLAKDLEEVAENLPHDAPLSVRVSLANALQSYDADLKASRVLDGQIDLSRDTEATRLYLETLASSGRDTDFAAAIRDLPESVLNEPAVVWLQAAQAFNRGDLDGAEKHARRLRALKPTDLKPTMILLESLVRRRRDAAIKQLLTPRIEETMTGSLGDRIRLGQLLVAFRFVERGQALLYRLLLEHRDDPKLWLHFGASVLNVGRKKDAHLDVTEIADDVYVKLGVADGTELEFVVESDQALRRLDPAALEPSHPNVAAVLGLKSGDSFTLPDGRSGVVGELRHKFVARTQAVLQEFEARFPKASGFKSVRVDVEAEGGLDNLKALAKARADFVDDQANAYEAGEMPLAVLAHNIGVTTIDAAKGLGATGRKFQVAIGNEEEREASSVALRTNDRRGVVVDAQTFSTIWELGAAEVIEAILGKIHYSANALVELQRCLEQFGEIEDEDGRESLSYRDGALVLQSTSAAALQAASTELKSAIDWLDKNGVLAPATIPDGVPDKVRELFVDMPAPLLDEIFIAKDRDLLLLVDDLRIRQWARGFGLTKSTWLQWALAFAVDEKIADMGAYAEWSAKLIVRGQTYIGLSPPTFFEALKRDAEAKASKPGAIFTTLATCLGGKNADMESHIRVAAQIIHGLWHKDELRALREPATGAILTSLLAERHGDYRLILGVLARVFKRHMGVSDYIRGWALGHFLEIG